MQSENTISIFSNEEWREWLKKNHEKEKNVSLIIHKKHTGKPSPSHRELMDEAICFGLIDTTLKRLDENTYRRNFAKRNKNSRWSNNTISYAKKLIKEKRMTPAGLHAYKEGLKKPTHDAGIPTNPTPPKDLLAELKKNKIAWNNFNSFSPSSKRTYLRWLIRAKQPETRKKRIHFIVDKAAQNDKSALNPSQKTNT